MEEPGISERRFRALARETKLRFYLPYAMGSAPWYRIEDVNDLVGSLKRTDSLQDFST